MGEKWKEGIFIASLRSSSLQREREGHRQRVCYMSHSSHRKEIPNPKKKRTKINTRKTHESEEKESEIHPYIYMYTHARIS